MAKKSALAESEINIEPLIQHFQKNKHLVSVFLNQILAPLNESATLRPYLHSIRNRVKDPDHLRDKLHRKAQAAATNNQPFDITQTNLFTRVNDLAGIRILHLHTKQIAAIDPILRDIFSEHNFGLLEGPFARTWDDEYREYFESVGIRTQKSRRMYTSVHYVVGSGSRTQVTCEIQVRTLAEEMWGEVDHSLNYPHPSNSVACSEQIRALARVTSSATRLVDAIFASDADFKNSQKAAGASVPRAHPNQTKKKPKRAG